MIVPDLSSHLDAPEQAALARMIERISAKRRRHRVRKSYYEGLQEFKDLGIAIPPNLRNFDAVLGWPAKGVDALARRVKLEGFAVPGGDVDSFGIPQIWRDNRLDVEAPQITTSSLIHATSFIATTLGDQAAGEPEVLISTYDAMMGTGLWRPTSRDLGAALLIVDEDDFGPVRFFVMFPHMIYSVWRRENMTQWFVNALPNYLGRVPVEPLTYRARLGRPFGQSRITRPVMSLTDSAARTVARAEVGAEFFSAPQRYLLGADESDFVGPNGERKTTWDLLMGRILAIGADEDTGDVPQVGQFSQISMQPHTEQMRMWASLFAAETGLALDSLGVVQDNPSSAEAMYAAEKDLVIEAEATCDGFTPAWVRAMVTGVQMRDNLTEIPDELRDLSIRWRDPSTPSRAAAVDAALKLTSGDNPIIPADSEVALELAGLSQMQIDRVMADRRRANGRATISALAALQGASQAPPAPSPTDAPNGPQAGTEGA